MTSDLGARLATLREEFEQALSEVRRPADLDGVKGRFLGRKGALPALLAGMGGLAPEERREAGRILNEAKAAFEGRFEAAREQAAAAARGEALARERLDVTLPGRFPEPAPLHIITRTRLRIERIFREMGYSVETGPEIEDDFHNFTALNIPPDHPARDAQDTFYVEGGWLLRTHTSPVQIRSMLGHRPPLKLIAPGPVYRRDYDMTHLPMFHQVEGLVVDRGIRFSDLKGTLELFFRRLFASDVRLRFSPTYFPFVEPGAEVNISCAVCGGSGTTVPTVGEVGAGAIHAMQGAGTPDAEQGAGSSNATQGAGSSHAAPGAGTKTCRTCRGSGWLEVMGAGMIHPAVFRSVGYDPEEYTGFAFGGGIDRIAMLLYGVDDLRLLLENDLRFLRQFPG
jgi:phenylalanyl-tRNA synthetase alpha chain